MCRVRQVQLKPNTEKQSYYKLPLVKAIAIIELK